MQITLLSNPILADIFTYGGVLFIFLSGISSQFSKRNALRGLQILGLGVLITVITVLFMPRESIYFGILHFLGTSILIYALIRPLLRKINQMVVFIGGLLLFFITYSINLQQFHSDIFLSFVVGFPSLAFNSADYFPLLPYFFAFLSGTGFGWYIANKKLPQIIYQIKLPGISFVGRYSLWVYLFHQPILLVVLNLIFFLTTNFTHKN